MAKHNKNIVTLSLGKRFKLTGFISASYDGFLGISNDVLAFTGAFGVLGNDI